MYNCIIHAVKLTQSFPGKSRPVIAAAKPAKTPKSSRKRTLDYTRRHVVVALLAVGQSRAQAAKYVRISPEMLQRVAECNSRFRYDMQKAELDYQTRKARRRLKRSLVDHASPDLAEEQRAAKAQAVAQVRAKAKATAQAKAEAKETSARIKASLHSDAEAWLKANPEGRSIFYNRELPDLAELETLAKSFPPLPAHPEFQLPESDLPKFEFDLASEPCRVGPESHLFAGPQQTGGTLSHPTIEGDPSTSGQQYCDSGSESADPVAHDELSTSSNSLAPTEREKISREDGCLGSSCKETLESKALARARAQKTWQESRRKYRYVRIVAAAKQRPKNHRLRNAPNPPKPRIRNLQVVLPQRSADAAPDASAATVRPRHPTVAPINVAVIDVSTCRTQVKSKHRRRTAFVALRNCGAAAKFGMRASQMLLAVLHAVLRLARLPANRGAPDSSPQHPASELCRMLHPNLKRHRWEVMRHSARPRDGPAVGWRKRSIAAAKAIYPP